MPNRPCMDQSLTRRAFVGAAGATLVWGRAARAAGANNKIVVAHIGIGGMGSGHLEWFANMPDVEVAALCDVDQSRVDAAKARLDAIRPGNSAQCVTDFRRVLERDDIDAVTTATPDHWHALIACMAMESGKDVYGEKPLSHHYAEARAMERTVERTGRIFQLGTQIHAGENYHRVVELVRSGALGRVHTVHLWKPGGSGGLGYPPDGDPPAELDWDMWLGPAPYRRFNPAICPRNFRHFWDYSGGVYADFWCHIADIAFWALEGQIGQPLTVSARGETPRDSIAETPAWIDVDYEFEQIALRWTTRRPDEVPSDLARDIGCWFEGDEGSLVCDYDSREVVRDGERFRDLGWVPRSIPRSPGHPRNFLDCVRSRRQPESNIFHARRMTTGLYLGEISFRLGRPLRWDAAHEQFVGDEAANRLLQRPCRAPWRLPT